MFAFLSLGKPEAGFVFPVRDNLGWIFYPKDQVQSPGCRVTSDPSQFQGRVGSGQPLILGRNMALSCWGKPG